MTRTLGIFFVYALQLSLILLGFGSGGHAAPCTAWRPWPGDDRRHPVRACLSDLARRTSSWPSSSWRWGVPPEVAGLSVVLLRLLQTLPMGLLGVASYVYLSRTMTRQWRRRKRRTSVVGPRCWSWRQLRARANPRIRSPLTHPPGLPGLRSASIVEWRARDEGDMPGPDGVGDATPETRACTERFFATTSEHRPVYATRSPSAVK